MVVVVRKGHWAVGISLAAVLGACDPRDMDGEIELEAVEERQALPDAFGGGLRPRATPPLAGDGVGAFRMQQCTVSHFAKDDPIVFPNQPGVSHEHMYFGNMDVDAFTTQGSLLNGTTTCPGGIRNLSGYWIPAMVDGSGARKMPSDIRVYYKGGYSVPSTSIQPAPVGLRMIAGDNLRTGKWDGASWRGCAQKDNDRRDFDECKQGETLELWLHFPQCWNGKDLDSADHRSHMAFPTDKGCPTTHPVPIPAVTYVVEWKVDTLDAKAWRMTSDKPTDTGGLSVHGDWWNGWKAETMQAFVNGCIRGKRTCNNGELGNGWQLVQPDESLNATVVDNEDDEFSGTFQSSVTGAKIYGDTWAYRTAVSGSNYTARFNPPLPTTAETYSLYVFASGDQLTTNQPFSIRHAGGTRNLTVDMKRHVGAWIYLGNFSMRQGDYVQTGSNYAPQGGSRAAADAIVLVPLEN